MDSENGNLVVRRPRSRSNESETYEGFGALLDDDGRRSRADTRDTYLLRRDAAGRLLANDAPSTSAAASVVVVAPPPSADAQLRRLLQSSSSSKIQPLPVNEDEDDDQLEKRPLMSRRIVGDDYQSPPPSLRPYSSTTTDKKTDSVVAASSSSSSQPPLLWAEDEDPPPVVSKAQFAGILAYFLACYLVCHSLDALSCSSGFNRLEMLKTPAFDGIADSDGGSLEFREPRAREILRRLAGLGPKVVGSWENEVLAVKVIQDALLEIVGNSGSSVVTRIKTSHQVASGSFGLMFLDNYTNVYERIQNIVVRLDPTTAAAGDGEDGGALLVNCHFDTPLTSPGASDDGVNCAAMLEVLRVLVHSRTELKHPVIFLFNGAEENFMQGSHAFVTQHAWSKEARIFINLEAAGSGGREILFQAGPNHASWLLGMYKSAVRLPVSSGFWQDIFGTGLIPSDTDFRVFRDFGGMSGLDIAFVKHGYVYHTRLDTEDRIPGGSLQRVGDHLLRLVLKIANSTWPQDHVFKPKGSSHGIHQKLSQGGSKTAESSRSFNDGGIGEAEVVFFDFAGLGIISYGTAQRRLLNLFAVGLFLEQMGHHAKQGRRRLLVYAKHVALAAVATLVSWLWGLAANFLMAFAVSTTGKSMPYYANPAWVLPLYLAPAIGAVAAAQRILSQAQNKKLRVKKKRDEPLMVNIYSDGVKLILLLALLVTSMGIFQRSSYIPTLLLLVPGLAELSLRLCGVRQFSSKGMRIFLAFQSVFILPFALTSLYAYWIIIPITGRASDVVNPDILVGAISVIFVVLLGSYVFPLLILSPWRKRLEQVCAGIAVFSLFLLYATDYGFPYDFTGDYPAVQRAFVTHFSRRYTVVDAGSRSKLLREDGGFWLPNLDWHTRRLLPKHVPVLQHAEHLDLGEDHCGGRLWCHVPYLIPAINLAPSSSVVKAVGPDIDPRVTFNHSRSATTTDRNVVLSVNFSTSIHNAPDHVAVVASPRPGWRLASWSFNEVLTPSMAVPLNGQPTYYVLISNGLRREGPLEFWILAEKDGHLRPGPDPPTDEDADDAAKLELVISASYQHGPFTNQSIFQDFQKTFPRWALTIPAAATVDVITRY